MEDQKLFQIGEVAKMFHVSMGTLRHYERSGLLTPEVIDERTGYRYYGIRQMEVLNTIRYLRVLDIPLPQIKEFLQNRDTQIMEDKLTKQKELIHQKIQELELIERKIDHRLEHIQDATHARLDEISLETIPAGRIVWIRDSLRPHSYLDLEYSIRRLEENQKESLVFLGKVGVGISRENLENGAFHNYDLVFLLLDPEDSYEGTVENYPEQLCARVRFRGSHTEAPAQYEKLMKHIRQQGFRPAGFSREITLIDYGLTSDPEKFVTEILIPVEKTE